MTRSPLAIWCGIMQPAMLTAPSPSSSVASPEQPGCLPHAGFVACSEAGYQVHLAFFGIVCDTRMTTYMPAGCREARDHGVQSVGLPSRLATFSEASAQASSSENEHDSTSGSSKKQPAVSWWRQDGGRANDRGRTRGRGHMHRVHG